MFDVQVERTVLQNVDVVKLGGGLSDLAIKRTSSAIVSDGFLTIQFRQSGSPADWPMISAIEVNRLGDVPPSAAPVIAPPTKAPITPPFQTILINCGGPAYLDSEGRQWIADRYSSGGNVYANSGNPIINTEDDFLYHSDRWGVFSYNIPVPLGNYKVILHFAETQ